MNSFDAAEFFKSMPHIYDKLKALCDVGLGYMRIGQSATTLSGGEAQRIKLAKELSKKATGNTFYILDEPTTGLHFEDISKLLKVLQQLVDNGNSVLVIEHNLDVLKTADYIIDIGPCGGNKGGYIVAEGTPEEIVKNKKFRNRKIFRKDSKKKLMSEGKIFDQSQTKALAEKLALGAKPGNVFGIKGTLGAGKTFFSNCFINTLLDQKQEILSPTFNIVYSYQTKKCEVHHFDLYRIKSLEDLENIGFVDYLENGICLIEWPEIAEDLLKKSLKENYIEIEIKIKNEEEREITINHN